MQYPKEAPPPYGMNPSPPPPQIQIVHTSFGAHPQSLVCPHCNSHVTTRVQTDASTKTHLMAILLCIIFCPLVCLPYCCESCQAKNHYCPRCNAFLGTCDN